MQGRNLGKLFRYLWLHRVAEIVEADTSGSFLAEESDCVIESLRFAESTLGRAVAMVVD